MLGESVYVTCEQFDAFVEAVRAFLLDLATALERVPRPSVPVQNRVG